MAQLGTVIVQTVRTTYALASSGTVRAGTIGLVFSTGGTANYVTAAGDTCAPTVIAGQTLFTGPLATVAALPAGTLGVVGL